jgi:hypothetical protein
MVGLIAISASWVLAQPQVPTVPGQTMGSSLQELAWIGTAIGALIAAASLRKTANQARATFLLSLNPLWNELEEARNEMISLGQEVTAKLRGSPAATAREQERLKALCEEYRKEIEAMTADPERQNKLRIFYTYLNFFEIVGLMVRNRYVRLHDVYLLYKGPIIQIDYAFSLIIPQWQQRFDLPPGLYENLLYLVGKVQHYDKQSKIGHVLRFWQ